MKRLYGKVLSVFLVFAMLLTLIVPITVYAEEPQLPDKVALSKVFGREIGEMQVTVEDSVYCVQTSISVESGMDSVSLSDFEKKDKDAELSFYGTDLSGEPLANGESVELGVDEDTTVYVKVVASDDFVSSEYTITISRAEGENDNENSKDVPDVVESENEDEKKPTVDSLSDEAEGETEDENSKGVPDVVESENQDERKPAVDSSSNKAKGEKNDENPNNIPGEVKLKTVLGEIPTIKNVEKSGIMSKVEASLSVESDKNSISVNDIIKENQNATLVFHGTSTGSEAVEEAKLEAGKTTMIYINVNYNVGQVFLMARYEIAVTRELIPREVKLKTVLGEIPTIKNVEKSGIMSKVEASLSVESDKNSISVNDIIKENQNATLVFHGTSTGSEAVEEAELEAGKTTMIYINVNYNVGQVFLMARYEIAITRAGSENGDENSNNITDKVELDTVLGKMPIIDKDNLIYDESNKIYTIAASLSVGSEINSVSSTDVAGLDQNATITFYGTDSSWQTTTEAAVNLAAGMATTVYVKVTAGDESVSSKYTVTITKANTGSVEITEFETIKIYGGTMSDIVYNDIDDVVNYLNDNYSHIMIRGTGDSIPVNSWVNKGEYTPDTEGNYTFVATLGTVPEGYTLGEGVTATAVVSIFDENKSAGVVDSVLQKKLCTVLGVSEDHDITVADMMGLTDTLDLKKNSRDDIQDYSGLRHAQNITGLDLSRNKLSGSASADKVSDLSYLSNLELLNLRSVEMGVHLPDIGGLKNLKELNLGSNKLTFLPNMTNMTGLEILDVRYNSQEGIPLKNISQIKELVKLKSLNISSCNLDLLPNLSKLADLEYLNARSNSLTTLDNSGIEKLSSLTQFIADKNKLKDIDLSEYKLTNLNYLSLNENELTSLAVKDLPELTELNVRANALGDENGHITLQGLPKLTKLNLASNGFKAMPDISSLTELTTIDISSNKLTDITGNLSSLTKVTEFNANYNEITSISNICDMTALAKIQVEDNNLQVLPDGINNITGLNQLNLNKNKLSHLPKDLSGLKNLKILKLSNNSFETGPDSFGHLTGLTALYLDQNNLKTLPSSMGNLKKLQTMDISYNKFSEFPDCISKLTALTEIDLGNNTLADLDVDSENNEVNLSKLDNLTCVKLNYNRISKLPKCMKALSNLNQLEMKSNYIAEIPKNYLSDMDQLDCFLIECNYIDFINDKDSKDEIQAFLNEGHNASNYNQQRKQFATLMTLDTSVETIKLKDTGAVSYSCTLKAPVGTTSITITPIGARSETEITMGDMKIKSGETLTVDGLTSGSNEIILVATNKIDNSTVNYKIIIVVEEEGSGEIDPDNLPDGKYIIDVDAMKEDDNSYSMTNQFITEVAKLKVENGDITATMVWHGTGEIKMSWIEGMWYRNKDGEYVTLISDDGNPNTHGVTYTDNAVLDVKNDALTITLPVESITKDTYMKVYVPKGMGEDRPVLRIVFNLATLVAEGGPDPSNPPVVEVIAQQGLAEITRDTIKDIEDKKQNVGLKFDDVSVNIPAKYIENYFKKDITETANLEFKKEETFNKTQLGILRIMYGKNILVDAKNLNLNLVTGETPDPITNLGGNIKVVITLTDEEIKDIENADNMKLCYYNPLTGKLEDINDSVFFNLEEKTVTFYTNHLSTYVVVNATEEVNNPGGGSGNTPESPTNNHGMNDGTYSIKVYALKESSNSASMANQFFTERAEISVDGDEIEVTVAMYGTASSPQSDDGIHMSCVDKVQYKDKSGEWTAPTTKLDKDEDSLRLNFVVHSINKPVYIRVLVPDYMGPNYKIFRLIFNKDSLKNEHVDFGSWVEVKKAEDFVITASAGDGGKISPKGDNTVDKKKNIVFTITPNEGHKIKDVLVDGKSVGEVSTYTFERVQNDHTIHATFEKNNVEEELTFIDIGDHWAKEYIKIVAKKGIFTGTGDGQFRPNDVVTRGMLVTVLGRLYGADIEEDSDSEFSDVDGDSYYSGYIAWAADNKIVNGVGENKFAPDRAVSREEVAVIFARYAEFAGIKLLQEEETESQSQSQGLKNGEYKISAKALMETKNSESMSNQFINEPASLNVKGGKMNVQMIWKGTKYITMDMIEELKYLNSNGEFVEVDRTFDKESNTLTIKFEVEDLEEATMMQVYVPKGMPGMRPKFRLVLDKSSIKKVSTSHVESSFTDIDKISSWAKVSVEKVKNAGIMQGKNNNMFDPNSTAKRAEIAKILVQLINQGEN
ncbi:MAG: NEAT domain-containing protein [Maledivibacter sp.]|jgi:Leucine-rich repeat (LRR) protein/heme-binding NEAT domain protein|nr:NEAT domain-containing protein [Maledivibacter sp.]